MKRIFSNHLILGIFACLVAASEGLADLVFFTDFNAGVP